MTKQIKQRKQNENCVHCGRIVGHFKTCLAYKDPMVYLAECGFDVYSFSSRRFLGGVFTGLVVKGTKSLREISGTSYMIGTDNLTDFILENNL